MDLSHLYIIGKEKNTSKGNNLSWVSLLISIIHCFLFSYETLLFFCEGNENTMNIDDNEELYMERNWIDNVEGRD